HDSEPAVLPAPPPQFEVGPPPILPVDLWEAEEPESQPEPPPPPAAPTQGRDTDQVIGAQILPRVGAGLVLAALAFFGVWAYQAGYITQPMAFGAEIAFSLFFLVLGLIRHKEQEQFGEVLKGTGAGGLFVSFASGHLYHGLYSAEQMMALCLATSLVSMLYGAMSGSRTFIGIGLLGGFVTAWMPLQRGDTTASAELEALIVAPALVILSRNGWRGAIALLWIVAELTAVAFLSGDSRNPASWSIRVAYADIMALTFAVAFAKTESDSWGDGEPVFVSLVIFVAAVSTWLIQADMPGAIHEFSFGLAGVACALGCGIRTPAGRWLAATSICVGTLLPPFGLNQEQAGWAFSGLALAFALLGMGFRRRDVCWLSSTHLALGAAAFISLAAPVGAVSQSMAAGALLGACLAGAAAHTRAGASASVTQLFSSLLGFFVVSRWAGGDATQSGGLSAAWSVFALALLGLGLAYKSSTLRNSSYFLLAMTLYKVLAIDLAGVQQLVRVALLLVLGLVMLLGGYLTIRWRSSQSAEGDSAPDAATEVEPPA
ncbi:MAG: DUF2339 domain-containing protein, partial [Fimbriimonas ginsengisoli]|nr:DUF2339 domain-containing protein [Fimbriimonas ginsengisoli]